MPPSNSSRGSYTLHMHTCANNSEDDQQASTRTVCVVKLCCKPRLQDWQQNWEAVCTTDSIYNCNSHHRIYNTLHYRKCKNTSTILLGDRAQFTAVFQGWNLVMFYLANCISMGHGWVLPLFAEVGLACKPAIQPEQLLWLYTWAWAKLTLKPWACKGILLCMV